MQGCFVQRHKRVRTVEQPEEWRDIEGTNGKMQVSTLGRVRSGNYANGYPMPEGEWRICKLSSHDDGYLKVGVNGTTMLVHDLVLRAFVGPAPAGQIARHIDGDPTDNQLTKLKWGTRSQNNQDTARHFRIKGQKLTEDDAWGIKLLLRLGHSSPLIQQVYPQATGRLISNINCGTTWRHLQIELPE